MDPSTRASFEHLAADAWRETAKLALRALGRRGDALGEAVRALPPDLDATVPWPRGAEALAAALAARVPEPLRPALREAVDWELHTFRGGREVEASHRLEVFDAAPASSASPAIQPAPGFDAAVLALDLSAPHSMGDLSRYANAYLGRPFVDDALAHGRVIELHNGTAEEAMGSLRARGAAGFHHLATPKLHFQILLTDDLRYAIACDDGPDMFHHLQKVLRAARTASGQGVDAARVSRFDHRRDEAAYRPARLRRCFTTSGPIPRQVTVGFKNALLGELGARARRVAQVRALQRAAALPEPLRPLRALDARALLHAPALRARLDALETGARRAGLGALLDEGPRVTLAVTDGSDDFLDHSRLTYRDARGDRRSVLLTRNPYGEAAVAMGALLRDCGAEQVLVYGTAHDFVNHALDPRFAALHALPGTRRGSRVVNVRSPIDELDAEIVRLRGLGHHLVEMELAGLLRGLAGSAQVHALHVVSDVPQSADTLEGFSPAKARAALAAAVDVWVAAFGIADLEP